ncbi:MAG: hypothetical protein WD009_01180 [Phycisphaeraceae bacterium]
MTWHRVFLIVTGCALMGLILGGLFGLGAGWIAPQFFSKLIPAGLLHPHHEIEPLGTATFLGATVGVVLGGVLGAFAVTLQTLVDWRGGNPKP